MRGFEEEGALQADIYLESLLARGLPTELTSAAVPATESERRAALLLQRTLVRFHPSFRFEEALSARLAGSARDVPGDLIELRRPVAPGAGEPGLRPEPHTRGLLLGGAIASGVSIAGALFAWRRTRPTSGSLGPAARAAHRSRARATASVRRPRGVA